MSTKFVVKVNRSGIRTPRYVQKIDRIPLQMTSTRKLALMMGRFTAEDVVKSIRNPHCSPEFQYRSVPSITAGDCSTYAGLACSDFSHSTCRN
jgi:hypothetical protein